MGVHHYSGILNPVFLRGPTAMMNGHRTSDGSYLAFVPVEQRTNFALSVISDCNTPSFRKLYISELLMKLGHEKIHQYGKCGNMHLPPKPIERAMKVISTYKFYLAFENTIMNGYVTEKLTSVLMMNVLPVYYGTLDAPNITKTPSYIRASDFKTPGALAEYMLYLNKNHTAYMAYHAWRTDASLFDDEYLDTIQNRVPGPVELQAHTRFQVGRVPPRGPRRSRSLGHSITRAPRPAVGCATPTLSNTLATTAHRKALLVVASGPSHTSTTSSLTASSRAKQISRFF